MKSLAFLFIFLISILSTPTIEAQEKTKVDKAYRSATIETLSEMILERYVYEDVAKKTVDHLKKQSAAGAFDQFTELEAFAEALTETVQAINNDKHMRIRPRRATKAPENTPERLVEEMLYRNEYRRETAAGFREVRKIDGNIGYFDLRGFAGVDWGSEFADRYMYLIATSDAIIIDLRKNGGGDPSMVQYLCSYFFEGKVHLNSLFWRDGNRTVDFYTLDEVGGEKMPDVPLFVLTSKRTFSGAEEFSYNMQTQKRATLIGETTGGGANPGGTVPINKELGVFIPTGAAVNPITKTNWEGVGVVPDVKVPVEEALDKAIELATEAAEQFRAKNQEKQKALFSDLGAALSKYKSGGSDAHIMAKVKSFHEQGLLNEGSINSLGYEYMMGMKNAHAAEAIFKANTLLFPESANTYDSYGEALAANGKLEAAVKSYQKAVKLATAHNDGNLEVFKENLAKVKSKAMEK